METENLETTETIETDQGTIEVIETETAPVVIVETETVVTESSATISQLVETIGGLTDSIQALRLQVETERNSYLEMIFSRFDDLSAKIEKLNAVETAEHHQDDSDTLENIKEVSNKPVKRWL